ncbi:hypothetical protein V1504DRAFT_462428, partial [Lipomyces starkeyi]
MPGIAVIVFADEERKKYAGNLLERLYVCSRCFKYTSKASEMGQHWVRQCLFFPFLRISFP